MKVFKLFLFSIPLFFTQNLQGQKEPYFFEKVYTSNTLDHYAIFENSDVEMQFLDTVVANKIYLAIVTFAPRKRHLCLVKKDLQHWLCYSLGNRYTDFNYKLLDFDSIPGKEIQLSLRRSNGRSTWSGGFSEYITKKVIISLKDFNCYFSIEYMACYINWSNILETDNDPTKRDEIIGSEIEMLEGTEIELQPSYGKLVLREVESDCGSDLKGYEGPEPVSQEVFEYELRGGKLVLKSKN